MVSTFDVKVPARDEAAQAVTSVTRTARSSAQTFRTRNRGAVPVMSRLRRFGLAVTRPNERQQGKNHPRTIAQLIIRRRAFAEWSYPQSGIDCTFSYNCRPLGLFISPVSG